MKRIEKGFPASLLFMILAALLSGSDLLAQGSRRDEIRVPAEALRPAHSKEYFEGSLKNFKTWLENLAQLPARGEEFKTRAREFGEISSNHVSLQLANMRSVATDPDLEEVTRLPRSWYAQIYNAALPIQSSVRTLVGMKVFCVEKDYQKARVIWENAVDETLEIMGKMPKKLSKEELEVIAAKNRERRRKEYIRQYRAKQAEALKKAKDKAAGKKRSDKPKNTTRETEER